MRKKPRKIASIGIFVSLFTLSSCVDNSYDLNKDVDMTISVGGSEFAIPGGYTDKWTLDKVLDLEENSLVQADKVTGNYAIIKKGDPSAPANVRIDEVNINEPNVNPINVDLTFNASSAMPSVRAVADGKYVVTLTPNKYSEPFKIEKDDVPVAILDIDYIDFNMDTQLHFEINGLGSVADALHFEEISVDFPIYLVSNEFVTNGKVNQYIIRNVAVDAKGLDRVVHIKGIDFAKVPVGEGFKNHSIDINGKVTVNGTVYLLQSELKPGVTGNINLDMDLRVKMGEIDVENVTGKINPDINIDNQVIVLNDVPEFLQDKGVVLDVYNPMINVSVINEAPVPVEVNAVLRAIKKEWGTAAKEVPVPPFIVNPGTIDSFGKPVGVATEIQLSKLGGTGEGDIKVDRINELIEEIPDEIQLVIGASVEKYNAVSYTIPVNEDYKVETGYDVDVPLAFGPDLKIVYNDTINGWNNDIKDYEVSQVNLHSDVYNSIPLNIVLLSDAIDIDGNVLDGIIATVDKTIAAGTGNIEDGTFQSAKTVITITLKETIPGTIKKLDGLTIRANADVNQGNDGQNSTVGKNLNKNQYLQLTNIKLKVPGGLKIDLN